MKRTLSLARPRRTRERGKSMREAIAAATEAMFDGDKPDCSSPAAELMNEAAMSMMNTGQLFPMLCPELLAVMFEVVARRFPRQASEYFRYILRARRFADDPKQMERIYKEWRPTCNRLEDEIEAIRDPGRVKLPELPAEVIGMAAWLDSHPRPIRNLLFAEKGGDD
jgi:hypothetical protein